MKHLSSLLILFIVIFESEVLDDNKSFRGSTTEKKKSNLKIVSSR